MTTRAVSNLQAFPFRADFDLSGESEPTSPPPEPGLQTSAEEIARLAGQERARGARSAQQRLDEATAQRLETAVLRLEAALADLGVLAEELERAGQAGLLPERAAHLATLAAQRIADGQGDLFATCQHFGGRL